jgi:uncharacterized protein (TIGR02118 family)
MRQNARLNMEPSMSITVAVMYPNTPGSKFDLDYYLGTHAALVHRCWDGMGLRSMKAVKGIATPDPKTPPPYQVIALLNFDSLDAFKAAVSAKGHEVMGDIPNFTDVQPTVQISSDLN